MGKKSFVVISGLSLIFWYLSRILQELIYALSTLIDNKPDQISLFSGRDTTATGFPIFLSIDAYDPIRYHYYSINIICWFLLIYFIWKRLKKNKKK